MQINTPQSRHTNSFNHGTNCNNTTFTTHCQNPKPNCTKKAVGKFVCMPCNKLGFNIMYVVKSIDDCCVEKACDVVYSVKCGRAECVSFKDLYYVEYELPDLINRCDHKQGSIEITITCMEKLELFRYEGAIRRYNSCCGDIFFIELPDTHEVRILNPDMLMPKRESKPTNEGTACDCCDKTDGYVDRNKSSCKGQCPERTTVHNNFTNYNKVIIQGFSLDRLTSCECSKRYLHIHDFCYYGVRCK